MEFKKFSEYNQEDKELMFSMLDSVRPRRSPSLVSAPELGKLTPCWWNNSSLNPALKEIVQDLCLLAS